MPIIIKLKHKKLLLALGIASLFSIFYIYSSVRESLPPDGLPSATPTPSALQAVNSYPSGEIPLLFPVTAITITFNRPISEGEVKISTDPPVKLITSLSEDKLFLYARPEAPWQLNKVFKYQVTSANNVVLLENSLKFTDPSKNPPAEHLEEIYRSD